MLVYWYINTPPHSYVFTFLFSEFLVTCRLCDLAYPLFYGFTGSISPVSRALILTQYKSPFSTCTILLIRSVTLYAYKFKLLTKIKIHLIFYISLLQPLKSKSLIYKVLLLPPIIINNGICSYFINLINNI